MRGRPGRLHRKPAEAPAASMATAASIIAAETEEPRQERMSHRRRYRQVEKTAANDSRKTAEQPAAEQPHFTRKDFPMENTKRDMTRRTIMRAARIVYEEKGIENASFSDIAERAKVSRSTVFNYFAGTQEMLTALCGKEIADLEAAYEAGGHRGKEGIISIFETLVEDTAKFPKLVTSIIYSALVSGSEDNPLKMIEELLARNLEDDEDGIKNMLLMGAYYGLVNHYHMSNLPFEGEKMKEQMREMIDAVI